MSAPWGTYLERDSVHACTQEYTREYTAVYTRVHTTPLGEECMPGASSPQSTDTPRAQISLSAVDAPRLASPRPLVISCALP